MNIVPSKSRVSPTFPRERIDIAWLLLVAVTLISFASIFVPGHATVPGLGAVNIVLAFAKAWVVGNEFMELRSAPRFLRILFAGWVCLIGSLLTALCWL